MTVQELKDKISELENTRKAVNKELKALKKELEEREVYNGDVICTKNTYGPDSMFTVGKIYHFENGISKNNSEEVVPRYYRIKDFKHLCESFNKYGWLEVKQNTKKIWYARVFCVDSNNIAVKIGNVYDVFEGEFYTSSGYICKADNIEELEKKTGCKFIEVVN